MNYYQPTLKFIVHLYIHLYYTSIHLDRFTLLGIYLSHLGYTFVHLKFLYCFVLKENVEPYLWPSQTFMTKSSIIDAWESPKYASEMQMQSLQWLDNWPIFSQGTLSLLLLKILENCKVFWCFQGVEKGCMGNKWINKGSTRFSKSNFDLRTW